MKWDFSRQTSFDLAYEQAGVEAPLWGGGE
jgi:hypothetical protein